MVLPRHHVSVCLEQGFWFRRWSSSESAEFRIWWNQTLVWEICRLCMHVNMYIHVCMVLSGTEWYGMVWYGMVSMHACMHQHMDQDIYIYTYSIYMFSTRMVWTFQDSTPFSGFFPRNIGRPRWCLVQKQQCRVSLFKKQTTWMVGQTKRGGVGYMVDGRNPAPVDMVIIPLFAGFL